LILSPSALCSILGFFIGLLGFGICIVPQFIWFNSSKTRDCTPRSISIILSVTNSKALMMNGKRENLQSFMLEYHHGAQTHGV
jgi:hypothetical protein